MDRREFLKGTVAVGALAAIPFSAQAAVKPESHIPWMGPFWEAESHPKYFCGYKFVRLSYKFSYDPKKEHIPQPYYIYCSPTKHTTSEVYLDVNGYTGCERWQANPKPRSWEIEAYPENKHYRYSDELLRELVDYNESAGNDFGLNHLKEIWVLRVRPNYFGVAIPPVDDKDRWELRHEWCRGDRRMYTRRLPERSHVKNFMHLENKNGEVVDSRYTGPVNRWLHKIFRKDNNKWVNHSNPVTIAINTKIPELRGVKGVYKIGID